MSQAEWEEPDPEVEAAKAALRAEKVGAGLLPDPDAPPDCRACAGPMRRLGRGWNCPRCHPTRREREAAGQEEPTPTPSPIVRPRRQDRSRFLADLRAGRTAVTAESPGSPPPETASASSLPAELQAMATAYQALAELDEPARRRALGWLMAVLGDADA